MNSHMQGFERNTLMAVLNSKRVWLVHLVANALLMIAFFYWTRIPEETGWYVALTLVGGLSIVLVTLWLHSATFDYFSVTSEHSFASSLRRSVARIPAFFTWTLIFGVGLSLIGQLWAYDDQIGGWTRHSLPLFLRSGVTPRTMFSASHWMTWFLYFFLWPVLLLPIGGQVATKNFRGFVSAAAFRPIRRWRFWIVYLACFVIGAYIPFTLAWMVPRKSSPLSDQTWSMALRLGFGYLLLVTAWVILCAAIMRGSAGEDAKRPAERPEERAAC
jgi:hypothetical protein